MPNINQQVKVKIAIQRQYCNRWFNCERDMLESSTAGVVAAIFHWFDIRAQRKVISILNDTSPEVTITIRLSWGNRRFYNRNIRNEKSTSTTTCPLRAIAATRPAIELLQVLVWIAKKTSFPPRPIVYQIHGHPIAHFSLLNAWAIVQLLVPIIQVPLRGVHEQK